MKLKIIATGSKGNCYILESDKSALVIDCGISFKEIKKAVDFNTRKIAGVLISHSHNDHCRCAREIDRAGIEIYTSPECAQELNLSRARKFIIPNGYRSDTTRFWHNEEYWIITAFYLEHDVKCMGFLIHHKECGNVLYITDTKYSPYTFKDLNNVIIEANYCQDIIDSRSDRNKFVRDRVIQSHMSIQQCIDTLRANDLSQVNNIVLIHLSDNNSDENKFREMVENATGRNVIVARNNMQTEFNLTPF